MQTKSDIPLHVIRMAGLKIKTGRSKSALYDIQNPRSPRFDATFPKRCQLGPRTVGWLEHEVDAWLLSRKAPTSDLATGEHVEVVK